MMTRFAVPRALVAGLALAAAAACSGPVQNAASADFRPVYPVAEVAPTGYLPSGSIYDGSGRGLFVSDRRAAQVGDILTVEFTEAFNASKSQNMSTSRNDDFDLDLPDALTMGLDNGLVRSGSDQSFQGQGSAEQSNSLEGRVSVSVVRVLPGGLFEILGQKKLTLNNGDEYVRLSGVVRQSDISPDNVIPSDRIANAEIVYIGAGEMSDAARKGWLSRGLAAVSPF